MLPTIKWLYEVVFFIDGAVALIKLVRQRFFLKVKSRASQSPALGVKFIYANK